MIEPTAEMIALFDVFDELDVYAGDTVPAILRDLLALVERETVGGGSASSEVADAEPPPAPMYTRGQIASILDRVPAASSDTAPQLTEAPS